MQICVHAVSEYLTDIYLHENHKRRQQLQQSFQCMNLSHLINGIKPLQGTNTRNLDINEAALVLLKPLGPVLHLPARSISALLILSVI